MIVYAVVAALFFAFFFYLSAHENTSVYKARETRSGVAVKDSVMTELRDESAPIGIRQEYRWTLGDTGRTDAQSLNRRSGTAPAAPHAS